MIPNYMTTIIIEDEKPAARLLQRKLEKLNVKVGVMLHSVAEAIDWFSNNEHPDLIFLDIQLSDGLSFEIFDKIEIKSAVIFTTAYDEYALRAFKLNSIDYLLKPIDEDDLEVAVSKFKVRLPKKENEMQNLSFDFEQIKRMLSNPFEKNHKKRFTVKIGQHLKVISTDEIECFFSENKIVYLQTKERNFPTDFTLDELQEVLDEKKFFRVNRQFIISSDFIKNIHTSPYYKVELEFQPEEEITVSRDRVKEFKEWLSN